MWYEGSQAGNLPQETSAGSSLLGIPLCSHPGAAGALLLPGKLSLFRSLEVAGEEHHNPPVQRQYNHHPPNRPPTSALSPQAAEGSSRRGIGRYIKKKSLEPLETYVPAVVAARNQLRRAGTIMSEHHTYQGALTSAFVHVPQANSLPPRSSVCPHLPTRTVAWPPRRHVSAQVCPTIHEQVLVCKLPAQLGRRPRLIS